MIYLRSCFVLLKQPHKFMAVISVAILLTLSCASPVEPIEEEEDEVLIDHQLSGNIAIGVPAQYASTCTVAIDPAVDICTRANRNGDYILNDIDTNQGWLIADYINSVGESITLHSAFFVLEENYDALVNINPTTDIMSQVWLGATQSIDLESCIETDCFNATQTLLSESVFNTIETNLATVLREFWPIESGSIRTDDYLADPFSNELDLMHELINYELDYENRTLFIRNNNQELMAQAAIDDLILENFTPEDIVLENEMQAALAFERAPPSGSSQIDIVIEISPFAFGEAPFRYEINTSQTSTTLPGATLTFEHFIIAPDSSIQTWSENYHSGTLTLGGVHDVIVEVSASSGERAIQGSIITLARDENTPATYGNEGSCRPEILDKNELNLCLELLDGGDIKDCDENNTYIHVNSRCSQTSQLNGSYIGQCSLVDTEVRRNHYQNPLKINIETNAEQITRLAQVCADNGGEWEE